MMKIRLYVGLLALLLVTSLLTECVKKQQEGVEESDSLTEDIFNENADATADIEAAIQRAQENEKRVLLMFGGDWCSWSQRLYKLFQENAEVSQLLNDNFELVMVDLGRRDRNMDIDEKYGYPNELGLPALVVLDADGQQLYTQETGSLEYPDDHTPKGHDPDLVIEFLREWVIRSGQSSS